VAGFADLPLFLAFLRLLRLVRFVFSVTHVRIDGPAVSTI